MKFLKNTQELNEEAKNSKGNSQLYGIDLSFGKVIYKWLNLFIFFKKNYFLFFIWYRVLKIKIFKIKNIKQ